MSYLRSFVLIYLLTSCSSSDDGAGGQIQMGLLAGTYTVASSFQCKPWATTTAINKAQVTYNIFSGQERISFFELYKNGSCEEQNLVAVMEFTSAYSITGTHPTMSNVKLVDFSPTQYRFTVFDENIKNELNEHQPCGISQWELDQAREIHVSQCPVDQQGRRSFIISPGSSIIKLNPQSRFTIAGFQGSSPQRVIKMPVGGALENLRPATLDNAVEYKEYSGL